MPPARLQIRLLGDFHLTYDGRPVAGLNADRPQTLLAYLLLHRESPQSRQHLAFLLWPDSTEGQARSNLRNLLHTLRQGLPDADNFLLVESTTLQWRPDASYALDVAEFDQALLKARQVEDPAETQQWLEAAVAVYQGDLLPGNYDDWLIPYREARHQAFLDTLETLIQRHQEAGQFRQGILLGQRLLQLDPLNEATYIQLMRLHAFRGDRAGVRRVYQNCVAVLDRELNVEPAPATTAAYEQLLRLETAPQFDGGEEAIRPPDPPWRPRSLPVQATPFIGREAELADLAQLLDDPTCRLLTIVALGGMGKTRLALQAAVGHQGVFADGVAFVSLAGAQTADLLVPAIADALQFRFSGPFEPRVQLSQFLAEKELLLVLDNFEHLLEGAEMVAEILTAAPKVKVLVTSRQRLALQGEWVFEIDGMTLPETNDPEALAASSALALFRQSAGRVSFSFRISKDELEDAARICRLVGGMPLAIELAASWVRLLTCAEIAGEIERGLRFLSFSLRDIPARHHSIQAVFDHSWHLLKPAEQAIMARLSVFRGGFTREAAGQVAGAALSDLSDLVSKSLVRRSENRRYDLHELIRQYTGEQLRINAESVLEVQARHARYFLKVLGESETLLRSNQQKELFEELQVEIDNLRIAWEFAVENREIELLRAAAGSLFYFFELQQLFREARGLFGSAAAMIQDLLAAPGPALAPEQKAALEGALADMQVRQAFFYQRSGRNQEALVLYHENIRRLQTLDEPFITAVATVFCGIVSWAVGKFSEAALHLRAGLPMTEGLDHFWVRAVALGFLGALVHDEGDYPGADQWFQQAMAHCREIGDPYLTLLVGNLYSRTARTMGNLATAQELLCESLEVARQSRNRWAIGLGLEQLAAVEQEKGNLPRAAEMLEESCSLHREVGDLWSLSRALNTWARLTLAQADLARAEPQAREAVRTAVRGGYEPNALDGLATLAEIQAAGGKGLSAWRMTTFIAGHPASPQEARHRAEQLSAALAGCLSASDTIDPLGFDPCREGFEPMVDFLLKA